MKGYLCKLVSVLSIFLLSYQLAVAKPDFTKDDFDSERSILEFKSQGYSLSLDGDLEKQDVNMTFIFEPFEYVIKVPMESSIRSSGGGFYIKSAINNPHRIPEIKSIFEIKDINVSSAIFSPSLKSLQFKLQTIVSEQDSLDIFLLFSFDMLSVMSKKIGPFQWGIEATALKAEQFYSVSSDMAKLTKLASKLNREYEALDINNPNDKAKKSQLKQQLQALDEKRLKLFLKMINQNTKIAMYLTLVIDDQKFEFAGDVTFNFDANKAPQNQVEDIHALAKIIECKAELKFNKNFITDLSPDFIEISAEQKEEMLEMLTWAEQQGYLILKDDEYFTVIHLKDGKITLNDKATPFEF